MNTEIHTSFVNAMLADACYVAGLNDGDEAGRLAAKLEARLTLPLATYIGANFKVVTQWTDSGSSGFSVTVFEDKATMQRYVSLRGTEPGDAGRDFGTDGDAYISSGLARSQIIAMANWYLRATAPSNESFVLQFFQDRPFDPLTGELGSATYFARGEGTLLGAGSLQVNGHSLGGHLTTVFSRLFAGSVSQSYTYNGLGVGRVFPESFLADFASELNLGTTSWPDTAKQNNYFAEHGINVATTDWWLSQKGQRIEVFNEEGTGPSNHGMYKLTDSLALADVMGILDEQLTLANATRLLDAASAQADSSLEKTLDTLRTLLQRQTNAAQIGDAENSAARVDYHQKLSSLRDMAIVNANRYRVELLTDKPAAALANLAKDGDIDASAYRYALKAGNPFAILGAPALYTPHNPNGELDLYDPATGKGDLSEQWIKDRSAYLTWVLRANTDDLPALGGKTSVDGSKYGYQDSRNWEFTSLDTDPAKTRTILVRANSMLGGTNKIIFGTDSAENEGKPITGGVGDDRLYGMAGKDELHGLAGNDHLEGGRGADTLIGGKGNDKLIGGLGEDTYRYSTGDGLDTILDGDGLGKIEIDGQILGNSSDSKDKRTYHFTDTANVKHTYLFLTGNASSGGDLMIDGKITVKNYKSGDLGITLDITPIVAPETTNVITRTGQSNYIWDGPGNDHIIGSADDDIIAQDQISPGVFRGTGDDLIEAGAGKDQAIGGLGNDVILGGSGEDMLTGGPDDDRVYADAELSIEEAIINGNTQAGSGGGEILFGDQGYALGAPDGNDLLIAGAGNDILEGHGGQDILIGGAGDDDIIGDVSFIRDLLTGTIQSNNPFYWEMQANRNFWAPWYYDQGYGNLVEPNAMGNADVIYAGNGNDFVWGAYGNDVIFGEGDDDRLIGEGDNDIILGGTGNDVIWGDGGVMRTVVEGADYLDGGDDNDTIYGGGGEDVLIGGTGINTLYGGAGRDTYVFEKGSQNTVYDSGDNSYRFGAGVDAASVKLKPGSLRLEFGDGEGGEVHLMNVDHNDLYSSLGSTQFEFADGSVLNATELLARGFDIEGTDGDDTLTGTNAPDRINGRKGNDTLIGGAGVDIQESRRWRDGERSVQAMNDVQWRNAA